MLSDVSPELAEPRGSRQGVALAFTGLGDKDTTVEALMRVNGARNWDELLAALRLYQTPTQNLVYADASGDIGFISPGLVPLRKSGDGLAPTDGASGAIDWIGFVPFEQLPQLHNPRVGFVFNANNANVAARSRADVRPGLGRDVPRAPHPAILRRDRQAQPGDLRRDAGRPRVSRRAGPAAAPRHDRADNERARQAQALLAGWDGMMDKDRAEPLIFAAFLSALHRILSTTRLASMTRKARSTRRR